MNLELFGGILKIKIDSIRDLLPILFCGILAILGYYDIFSYGIYSIYISNILYTLVNPLIYGTTLGKSFLFFLWLGICFLPIKFLWDDKKTKIYERIYLLLSTIFILIIILLSVYNVIISYELENKYINFIELPSLLEKYSEVSIIFKAYTIEEQYPVMYESTNVYNSHALKAAFCFLPKIADYDICGPASSLFQKEFMFLVFVGFIVCFIISIIIIWTKNDFIEKTKYGIVLFGLLISTIDGGPLSGSWILFFSLFVALQLEYFCKLKPIHLFMVPIGMLFLRNIIVWSYLGSPVPTKMLFWLLPIPFFFIKPFFIKTGRRGKSKLEENENWKENKENKENKKNKDVNIKFFGILIGILIFSSLLTIDRSLPVTKTVSFVAYTNEIDKLSVPYELVASDGNGRMNIVRFNNTNFFGLLSLYTDVYKIQKQLSFSRFVGLLENCGKNPVVYTSTIITNKSFEPPENGTIKILSSQQIGPLFHVTYECNCSGCWQALMMDARKGLNEDKIVEAGYYVVYSGKEHSLNSIKRFVLDTLPI